MSVCERALIAEISCVPAKELPYYGPSAQLVLRRPGTRLRQLAVAGAMFGDYQRWSGGVNLMRSISLCAWPFSM